MSKGERGRSESGQQRAQASEIRPVKVGNFGAINLTTGRQTWHGESYLASRAGRAIVRRAAKEVGGVKVVSVLYPGFEGPIEERGNRRHHVSVAGPEVEIINVKSKVGELADKVEGVTKPSGLGESFFAGRVRAIAKFEKS